MIIYIDNIYIFDNKKYKYKIFIKSIYLINIEIYNYYIYNHVNIQF